MIRKVWVVAAKDLLQLRKDRAALLMMFAVPLLLMAVLGSVFKSADSGSSISATLPVIDHDGGTQGRALIGALRQAPSVHVQLRSNQARVEKSVRDGDQVGLLIIPAGFSSALQATHPAARVTYYTVPNNTSVEARVARDTVQAVVQRFAVRTVMAGTVARAVRAARGTADPALTTRL